jgi:uncharacterized protein
MHTPMIGSGAPPFATTASAINWRKLGLFIALAYAISWTAALALWLSGVVYGSLLSIALIALLYMPAPAIATVIVQKGIYKAPLSAYGLIGRGTRWRWLLATTGGVWLLVLGAFAIIALAGNLLGLSAFGRVDWSSAGLLARIGALTGTAVDPAALPIPPLALFGLSFVQATIFGWTINLPFTFGEELGWRGLMLRETQALGFWRSNLLIGIVWGLWHAPIIALGHNFPGQPVLGVLMMTLFTIALSFPLAYCTIKTRSIWGPSGAHGVINALGGLTALFVAGGGALFNSVAGVAGIVAALLLTLVIIVLDRRFVREYAAL